MTTEERMNIIKDCFTQMSSKAGYEFLIKVDPRSNGHKFHIKLFDKDELIFETAKVRTQPEFEPILGERKQNTRSPDLVDLLETINAKLRIAGRQQLQIPGRTDAGYVVWLLFSRMVIQSY